MIAPHDGVLTNRILMGTTVATYRHCAHEYLQKCAVEIVDDLSVTPLVGETKPRDIPAQVRIQHYPTMLEHYYGTYAVQRTSDQLDPDEIGIVKFAHAFYCECYGGMAAAKTYLHGMEEHVFLSGTKVRRLLRAGQELLPEFTRPEVVYILREAFR